MCIVPRASTVVFLAGGWVCGGGWFVLCVCVRRSVGTSNFAARNGGVCSRWVGDAVMTGIFALTHLMACDGEQQRSRCAGHYVYRYPTFTSKSELFASAVVSSTTDSVLAYALCVVVGKFLG